MTISMILEHLCWTVEIKAYEGGVWYTKMLTPPRLEERIELPRDGGLKRYRVYSVIYRQLPVGMLERMIPCKFCEICVTEDKP